MKRSSLFRVSAVLFASASALGLAGTAPADAQYLEGPYDPYYDNDVGGRDRGPETFIDEFGRRVTVDGYGRVVSVERPRSASRRERREPLDAFTTGSVDGPGPRRSDDQAIYLEPGEPTQSLQDLDEQLPAAGDPIIAPNETTMPEKRPAPKVEGPKGPNAKAQIAAFQILMDRAGISPGVIDGRMGGNVDKAVAAYEEKFGTRIDPANSQALVEELDATGGPAIVSYTITDKDAAGPFVASIPDDYGEKAKLPAMSYARVSEMLAERFHMDENYLLEINPGADFNRPGTILKVASTGAPAAGEVARIVADKGREQVRAYDAAGHLLVAYPSTIGSRDTPSPSGTVQVARIAFDPMYTYNPKINFTQGQNKSVLHIPPGPNGPVGSIWIALSKPTYGIHGTPEPSKIGKTNSHGCVRLTNFDAAELARMVKPGVTVEFVD